MNIAIKANGGLGIGMGHIMRTLSLAKELCKYHDIIYLCDENVSYKSGIEKIKSEGFKVLVGGDAAADLIIVDSYNVNEEYFHELRRHYKFVVYIDDLNLFYHPVDLLVNQNINAADLGYTEPKVLLGTQYVLLREEFKHISEKVIKDRVSDILITVGGSDPHEITNKIIKELKDTPYTLHTVIGPAFTNVEKLLAFKSDRIVFYENANMKRLMGKCDLAISSCGSTLYELCACGTPSIGIVAADNQKMAGKKFQSLKLIYKLDGFDEIKKGTLNAYISDLSNNPLKRMEISQRMRTVVDGLGANRVTKYINNNFM